MDICTSVSANSGFVGIKFCQECNNMLYPKEDQENQILLYACRRCQHQQAADNPCIYVNKITHEIDELTQIVTDVISDPTLPCTAEHPCPKCHGNDAVFFQAQSARSEDRMTLYYVCRNQHCLHHDKYSNSLIMSTHDESDHSSLPNIHFIVSDTIELPSIHNDEIEISSVNDSKTELSSLQDNNAEQSTKNDIDEKPITTVSHSRRVHFPTDDTQLRLISYSPEPLSNQPLLSLGVILQRYRATCQRLQLRPLNCLVDQLSTMDDGRKSYYDRLDCLKIVNEKIDVKQIDAIEEILSRCRFHTLDFESLSIDDLSLAQLFDVIEYYESCTHINLSNVRSIGFQGYQALTKYIRKTNSLERLDMNLTRFDENSIFSFTRSLRLSSTLYELHVESCQLTGKLLQKFIQNLRSCICLRELYLCDNRLQIQDSLLINELIRTCGQFLFLLDLRNNALQDSGISHLASQLSQYDENHTNENSLHKISFQANQLTQQGAGFLAKSLLHNRTIRSLNLSQNNITNEGLFLLRDALLTNRTINELILRNCHLTDQAAIALAEFIAESTTIQYIDLRENNIQASGVCGMAIAMKNNKTLLKLDFDPIISTPTNLGFLSNNSININRTTNTNSLLSIANLRRMTTGLSSFTSNTPFNSNRGGGGGTRELLEQKARWMSDIATVCQRNILIYEEKLRLEEEEQNRSLTSGSNETNQKHSIIPKPDDIELKKQIVDTNQSENNTLSITIDNEHSTSTIQNNNEETHQSIDTSIKDIDEVEQSKEKSFDDNEELEDSLDIPINDDDDRVNQAVNTSSNDSYQVEQTIVIPIESNDEIKQSVDISGYNDIDIEQTMATSINDNHEVEQLTTDLVESVLYSEDQEQSESNIISQNSIITESSSISDLTDDIHNDDKRKLRHSDSLRLLRKKVKNENDNTSDDESQLS
ncbi:unnamed protein product [Rotaria sp. Silwood2]|nr:unnamed protein product [Rotaria sp. Silwood2]CAF4071992.1 unnamed protein product [Rotaria sp. Silwood2]CAF4146602.1 unnamed protein product [Rotaria sp. Silwood2]CAF4160330.1 unnamed protein product [Rotaria sp. Silwood2]